MSLHCKDCRHYAAMPEARDPYFGECRSGKMISGEEAPTPRDGLAYHDDDGGYASGVSMGPDFGCVHGEAPCSPE